MNKKGALTIFLLSVLVMSLAAVILIYSYNTETSFQSKSQEIDETIQEIKFFTESCLTNIALQEITSLGYYDNVIIPDRLEDRLGECFDYRGLKNEKAIQSTIYHKLNLKQEENTLRITLEAEVTILMDGKERKVNEFTTSLQLPS